MGIAIIDRLIMLIELKTAKAQTSADKLQRKLDGMWRLEKLDKFNNKLKALSALFLGMGLAFLFTGMAIARFTQNALRSLFQTFLMVEGEGGVVNNALHNLLASLLFLKFSIVDAFQRTGLLDIWVSRIEAIVNWFKTLDESTQATILNILVWGAIVGTTMMVMGMAMLFMLGPLALIGFIINFALLGPLIVIATIILLIIALVIIWTRKMTLAEKIMWSIVAVMIAIGIIVLLTVGWIGLIIIAVGLLIAAVLVWRREITIAIMKASQAFINFMLTPVNMLIRRLNEIIALYNRITRASVALIPEIGVDFSKNIAVLEAQIAAREAEGTPGDTGLGQTVTNIFNFEGDITDKDKFIDDLTTKMEEKFTFSQGSPQLG